MRKNKKLLLLMVISLLVALLPATGILAEGGLSLEITKSVDSNEFSKAGDVISYTYIFKNTGSTPIVGPFIATASDGLNLVNDGLLPESLAPGESLTVRASYTITADDIDPNSYHIDKGIILNRQDPVALRPITSEAAITIHRGPGLRIQKSADRENFSAAGDIIKYTYTVSHIGTEEAIYGSADGPAPGPFILKDDKIGDITSTGVTELTQGGSFSETAEYTVTQADMDAGFVTNTVTVQGSYRAYPNDSIQAEAQLTVPLKSPSRPSNRDRERLSIKLEKSADKIEFSEVGEIITYSYVISNTGNRLVRGDFYGSDDESFKLTDDKIADIDMSKAPTELDPGESFTVTAQYKVSQADLDAGEITNLAKVTAISGNYSLEDTDTVTIPGKKKEEPSIGDKLNVEDHFRYISGYSDNTVRPDQPITREEVAAVFYRLLTPGYRDSIKTSSHNFPDVNAGRWSEESIATLTNGKIIVGYVDGSFRPGNHITRAELAAIASRFDNLTPFTSNKFSDIENHWANQVINSASEKGWVSGYEDGTFRPDRNITRAEFVALVNNVLGRGVRKENILPDARQFPDLLESKWYYETMQEAINSHHYTRDPDTGHEIWTELY